MTLLERKLGTDNYCRLLKQAEKYEARNQRSLTPASQRRCRLGLISLITLDSFWD